MGWIIGTIEILKEAPCESAHKNYDSDNKVCVIMSNPNFEINQRAKSMFNPIAGNLCPLQHQHTCDHVRHIIFGSCSLNYIKIRVSRGSVIAPFVKVSASSASDTRQYRFCELCGNGSGVLECPNCDGVGKVSTRTGGAGEAGRVGIVKCKICKGTVREFGPRINHLAIGLTLLRMLLLHTP